MKLFIKFAQFLLVLAWFLLAANLFAQETAQTAHKYALVIGNGNYTGTLSKLSNPVNDANDILSVISG